MSEAVLTLEDVSLCYRQGILRRQEHWALRNINLTLHRGENLGVIGHNGSGKSTLLRLLSGIYAPDKGKIDHHGNRASLLSLQVGFLAHLTGRENAILSGMLLGKSREYMINVLPDIVEYTELARSIDKPLRTYSSGMKARLGFAVSYYADAEILLVDEILGVGDTSFREKSAATMRDRIASNNAVVLVSHNPKLIRSLCTRVIWLENGKIVDSGDMVVMDRYEQSIRNTRLEL